MSEVKERPILFSAPMVRAILEGRKTQTRRVLKAKDADPSRCITLPTLTTNIREWRLQDGRWFGLDGYETMVYSNCPYGKPGDRLWVRETWTPDHGDFYPNFPVVYRADRAYDYERNEKCEVYSPEQKAWYPYRWRAPRFMPRWASRINLEVEEIKVERVQDISEEDATSEGCSHTELNLAADEIESSREQFSRLWQSINSPESWAANPWVWVVKFKTGVGK